MKLKYNTSGVLVLLLTFVGIVFMFYYTYQSFITYKEGSISNRSLYDLIGSSWEFDVLTIPFWWAVLFILELSIIKKIEKVHIWIFLLQFLALLLFSIFMIPFLKFFFFCREIELLLNYFVIIGYIISGIVINFLFVGVIGGENSKNLNNVINYISIFKK
jgi:hypothetical protein